MITLIRDKELTHVEDWNIIRTRSDFRDNIDPETVKLYEIIGRYRESESLQCGLSSCHAQHKRGYIVTTTEGYVTNIGHICGKRHFGVDFETMSKDIDMRITSRERRMRLYDLLHRSDSILESVEELLSEPMGGREIGKLIQVVKNPARGLPRSIVDVIREAVGRNGEGWIYTERQETERERDIRLASRGDTTDDFESAPRITIRERAHFLSGHEVFYPENDIRKLLVTDTKSALEEFLSTDIDSMSMRELGQWAAWGETIDRNLENARESIALGRRFFSRSNLEPILTLVRSSDDRIEYKKFLTKLPA